MKKITLIFITSLTASTVVNAQYIPDPVFASQIASDCPTCIDGNHYLTSDAQQLTTLWIFGSITDLTGLDGFTNLQVFNCEFAGITTFPALPPNLESLSMELCNLTSVPDLPSSLTYLDLHYNNLSSLPSLPGSLMHLDCNSNQLTQLPALPYTLKFLDCGSNAITSLTALPDLDTLWCNSCSLTSLPDLPSHLNYLDCQNNAMSVLPALPSTLEYLWCSNNAFPSFPALPLSLTDIRAENIPLQEFPVLPPNLYYADFSNCNLNSFSIILPDSLKLFGCAGSNLSTLPLLPSHLEELFCGVNNFHHLPALPSTLTRLVANQNPLQVLPPLPPNLNWLDVHTDSLYSLPELPPTLFFLDVTENPMTCLPFLPGSLGWLTFDQTNIPCLPNYPDISYNYYPLCDAGNSAGCLAYPIISGNVYGDFNGNAIHDASEYNAGQVVVQTNPGDYIGITDVNGNYKIAVPFNTTNTTSVSAGFSSYYNPPSTTYTVTFDTISGQVSTDNNFGILATTNGANLEVNFNSQHTVPGFNSIYYIDVNNVGTTDIDGSVTFQFDPLLTYISADPLPLSQSGNSITWNISNLHPFETMDVTAVLNCPSSTPLGTLLSMSTEGTVTNETDINPANNSLNSPIEVIGSFDPNDKEVNDQTLTPEELDAGKYLEYTINFQNTGTAPATFINVVDTLSPKLDPFTFEMVASSHNYSLSLSNDLTKSSHPVVAKWLFNNIQLPDSVADAGKSHGFIKFKIKPNAGLIIGDLIQNNAGIFFDYNEPVMTNTATTLITLEEGVPEVSGGASHILVYPNPALNSIHIKISDPSGSFPITFSIFNLLGEKVREQKVTMQEVTMDVSELPAGMYVVRTEREMVGKFVKLACR